MGNRTECALLVMLRKLGFDYVQLREERERDLVKVRSAGALTALTPLGLVSTGLACAEALEDVWPPQLRTTYVLCVPTCCTCAAVRLQFGAQDGVGAGARERRAATVQQGRGGVGAAPVRAAHKGSGLGGLRCSAG